MPSIIIVPLPRLEPAKNYSRLSGRHSYMGNTSEGRRILVPPPPIEKFSPERLYSGPSKIPISGPREPLVTTRGSAFTDGVRVNIRKAHKTRSIFDIEFSFKHQKFNGGELGAETIRNARGDCQRKRGKCKRGKRKRASSGSKASYTSRSPSRAHNACGVTVSKARASACPFTSAAIQLIIDQNIA